MSTLTPDANTGRQVFDGVLPLLTSDDDSDNFYSGVYAHLPIEWSATEANQIKSLLLFMKSFVKKLALPIMNLTGAQLAAGPVRITGYNVANARFTVGLADADANSPAQLLIDSPLNTEVAWAATTAYSIIQAVRPSTPNGLLYTCSVAGTSAGTEPTWPTTYGDTVVDGGVTWTAVADPLGYHAVTFTSALDTSLSTVGNPVYLADTGAMTLTPPAAADKVVQIVGRVATLAVQGEIAGQIQPPTVLGTSWLQAQAVTMPKLVRSGTAGYPIVGAGAGADSAYAILGLAGGGTGQVTANAALNALLPSQTGNNGKVLGTDGADTSWVAAPVPPANSIANSQLAQMPTKTLKGNDTGGTADADDLTVAEVLAMLGADSILREVKAGDTTRTSTDSIADDPELILTLAASKKYKIKALVKIARAVSAGSFFSVRWNYTAAAIVDLNMTRGGTFQDWPDVSSFPSATVDMYCENTQTDLYEIEGIIQTTTTGDFSLQWTSKDANNVIVKTGSLIEATPVS